MVNTSTVDSYVQISYGFNYRDSAGAPQVAKTAPLPTLSTDYDQSVEPAPVKSMNEIQSWELILLMHLFDIVFPAETNVSLPGPNLYLGSGTIDISAGLA